MKAMAEGTVTSRDPEAMAGQLQKQQQQQAAAGKDEDQDKETSDEARAEPERHQEADQEESEKEEEEEVEEGAFRIHVTALDEVVSVNSFFTAAVFIGLSFSNDKNLVARGQDDPCNASRKFLRQLVLFEVLAFSCFLMSSLVAQGLKLHLTICSTRRQLYLQRRGARQLQHGRSSTSGNNHDIHMRRGRARRPAAAVADAAQAAIHMCRRTPKQQFSAARAGRLRRSSAAAVITRPGWIFCSSGGDHHLQHEQDRDLEEQRQQQQQQQQYLVHGDYDKDGFYIPMMSTSLTPRRLRIGMIVTAFGSIGGTVFLVLSMINVIQLRLGLLTCGSIWPRIAVIPLVCLVSSGVGVFISAVLLAFLR